MSRIAKRVKELLGDNANLGEVLRNAESKLFPYEAQTGINSRIAKETGVIKYIDKPEFFESINTKGFAAIDPDFNTPAIYIRPNQLPQVTDRTETHELAHTLFDHMRSPWISTLQQEVEAEGVAYGVGHRLGQPADANLDKIASYLAYTARKNMGDGYEDRNSQIVSDISTLLEYGQGDIKSIVDRFTKGVV
jgi:hypothetical protein